MIGQVICDFLNTALPEQAFMERPARAPKRFYLIEKTGGSMENWIRKSTIAIQSYAETMKEAERMNDDMIQAMLSQSLVLDEISAVRLNTDYNFTDNEYRYQAVFDITHD